jgi:flagella basal body P-ring formation protein FlgA
MIRENLIRAAALGFALALGSAAAAAPSLRLATLQPAAAPALKAEVAARADILTFGDLVAGLPSELAQRPAFRAPSLGDTGTIQAHRIIEALAAAGVAPVAQGAIGQVVVSRAARRIQPVEVEAALRAAIAERHGVDASALALSGETTLPAIVVEPELQGRLQVQELAFDPRSRRVSATFALPGSAALALRPVRVVGQMVETVEMVTPLRAINRGEIIQAADVAFERRPRDAGGFDGLAEMGAVVGKAARRALAPGQMLRAADLQRQEIIARNEVVTVVFEAPGLLLTMRGRAQEAGAQGDIISVQNLQSKKLVQATILAPGRVRVNGAGPHGLPSGRVAAVN